MATHQQTEGLTNCNRGFKSRMQATRNHFDYLLCLKLLIVGWLIRRAACKCYVSFSISAYLFINKDNNNDNTDRNDNDNDNDNNTTTTTTTTTILSWKKKMHDLKLFNRVQVYNAIQHLLCWFIGWSVCWLML